MKLLSLFLKDYRVLHNFTLPMEETRPVNQETSLLQLANMRYTLDLIVGVNGTGKSTLLRAIAEIFYRLEASMDIPFGFEIHYRLAGEAPPILISNLDEETGQILNKINHFGFGFRLQLGETKYHVDIVDGKYLPPLIVALTTGSEREWKFSEQRFQAHDPEQSLLLERPHPRSLNFLQDQTDWFLRELPGQEASTSTQPTADTRFLFLKEAYTPLIILCGILADLHNTRNQAAAHHQGQSTPPGALQQVLDACNVRALRGFSLKFRMNQNVLTQTQKDFIQKLDQLAIRHSLQSGSDYLLVFDLAHLDLVELFRIRPNALEIFRMLVSLFETDGINQSVLREVHLFLERRPLVSQQDIPRTNQQIPPLHLLTWLSDGEQSFLGRLCLLSLLSSGQNSETLILLDEPEVHFNDYWKRRLVLMIDQALADQESHVLMSTHSSITLSDVLNRNIRLLRRTQDYSHVSTPTLKTLGTDPDDIMVYIFDAEDAKGALGINVIERELRSIRLRTSDEEKRIALEQLLNQVGPGDLRFLIRRELHALESNERR